MCVGHKTHPFGNERHTIRCGLTSIVWIISISEGKYLPQHFHQKEYNDFGKTLILMLRMCIPIFGSVKDVALDSVFWASKGITDLEYKGVCAAFLIKKRRYWPKWVPGDLIYTHFGDNEAGDIGMIETINEDNNFFKYYYEIDGLCDEDNGKLDDTLLVRGSKDKKILHRQKWDEGDKVVHIPEVIWYSL